VESPSAGPAVGTPKFIPDLVYDLRLPGGGSDRYYEAVSRFSDQIIAEVDLRAGKTIRNYGRYVQNELGEPARSPGEYAIELLTLGMVFKHYAGAARATPKWAVRGLRELVRLRNKWKRLKPIVDRTRAWMTGQFLVPKIDYRTVQAPSMSQLPNLIEWLLATGEFQQEAERLKNWQRFLDHFSPTDATQELGVAVGIFGLFQREAERVLGAYTQGVAKFLGGEYAARGCREDEIFCGKPPVEYHLNMVAAEVMNRGLRADFERTHTRVVLVPACMRGPYESFCRAHISGSDMQCAACNPGCTVNRITRNMRSLRTEVYLVPHSTGFSRWLERWQSHKDVGVTAVACLLNILPGGYEMRARGIPSQCMPLDYPGCEKHWRPTEIATGVNEGRLVQIVAAPQR
jgi:hypothetical protein